MWNDYVETLDVRGLSARGRRLLIQFINLSDRSMAHPLSWRRFYAFIRYAHAHRARLQSAELQAVLESTGFTTSDAQRLAIIYQHGRSILSQRIPVFHSGQFWADK